MKTTATTTEPPMEVVALGRNDYRSAALAAVMAFVVYLRTLPPTVTGDDSGQLVAAAYTLGIAHPPGYPLWCMLGKLFTIILPFNSIAWRVAFMSSFFGAATCFVVCLIVIKLTANRIAGVAAGAVLTVSSEFWQWNVVAEMYSLNTFLMVLGMLLLLTWYETRQDKLLYGFAFVYGLGLCNHHSMHFMGPVFALFILSIDRRPWRRWRTYLYMAMITVSVWGIVHLYLPIRAMADPYCNWFNPRTLGQFWDVVTRRPYAGALLAEPRTVDRFLTQCWVFLTQYARQFTPWMAWLPVVGIYPLWKRNRYAAGLVCGSFLYIAVGLILIINAGIERRSMMVNAKFWIPAYVMAAILIGVAVAWIASLRLRTVSFKLAGLLLAAAVFVLPLCAHFKDNDKSHYYFAYDYAMNLAKTLEPNAVFFPSSDHSSFAAFYVQAVEEMRPDVTVATKCVYLEDSINSILPLELRSEPWIGLTDENRASIGSWLVHNTGRPVYYSARCPVFPVHRVKMADAGILFRMIPEEGKPPARNLLDEYQWHTLDDADIHGDYSAERIVADYHFARGRFFLDHSDPQQGISEMEIAIRHAEGHTMLFSDIGISCGEHNLTQLAKKCFLTILEDTPRHRPSLINLAVAYTREGDLARKADVLQRLVNLDEQQLGKGHPLLAISLNRLGGVFLNQGKIDEAHDCFTRAFDIDQAAFGTNHPSTARDISNLGIVFKMRGDTEQAGKQRRQAFDIFSKCLGPNHPITDLARQGKFIQGPD